MPRALWAARSRGSGVLRVGDEGRVRGGNDWWLRLRSAREIPKAAPDRVPTRRRGADGDGHWRAVSRQGAPAVEDNTMGRAGGVSRCRGRAAIRRTANVARMSLRLWTMCSRLDISEDIGRSVCPPVVSNGPVAACRRIPSGNVYTYFRVCPMFFSWSFYFAQQVHVQMLKSSGPVEMADMIVVARPCAL